MSRDFGESILTNIGMHSVLYKPWIIKSYLMIFVYAFSYLKNHQRYFNLNGLTASSS